MLLKKCTIHIFLLLLFIHTSCNSQNTSAQNNGDYFLVTRVIDGDTFCIDDNTPKGKKIRLIGIDAPESRKSEHKTIGYFGKEASDYLHQLLKGKKVRLEYDISRKDKYGRTLAYVYLEDGRFLNAELVKQGYATILTVPPDVKFAHLFLQLQQEARENQRGLWKAP